MPRPLLRFASNSLCLLSLLACVATCVLWVRSLYRLETISRLTADQGLRVTSVAGTLQFGEASQLMYPMGVRFDSSPLPRRTTDWTWLYPSVHRLQGRLGFSVVEGDYELGPAWLPYRVTVVPYWAVLMLCSILPAVWLLRRIGRLKHVQPSACPACGYDLRATPGRCPECGAVAKRTGAA